MTTGHLVLMTMYPPDLAPVLPNIEIEIPAGHNIDLELPAGHNIELEVVI